MVRNVITGIQKLSKYSSGGFVEEDVGFASHLYVMYTSGSSGAPQGVCGSELGKNVNFMSNTTTQHRLSHHH